MSDATHKRQFLACLGDPSRFSLLATLAGGPRCVTELAGLVGLSQSCTTRHLQALQREGIVSGERQGKRVVYSLGGAGLGVHPVLRWAFDLEAAGIAESPSPASPGRPRSGEPVSGVAGRTSRRRSTRVTTSPPSPPIDVTDALIVVHDSGWESDEGEDASSATSINPADSSLRTVSSPPAPHRADLDDFLL